MKDEEIFQCFSFADCEKVASIFMTQTFIFFAITTIAMIVAFYFLDDPKHKKLKDNILSTCLIVNISYLLYLMIKWL